LACGSAVAPKHPLVLGQFAVQGHAPPAVPTPKNVVNSIDFHPNFGTFVTAGTDGQYTYWDKDKKQKVLAKKALNAPITAAKFSKDGTMVAYAAGYDWSKGHAHKPSNQKAKIFLAPANDAQKK